MLCTLNSEVAYVWGSRFINRPCWLVEENVSFDPWYTAVVASVENITAVDL